MPRVDVLFWLPFAMVGMGLLVVWSGARMRSTERRRRASWRSYPGRVIGSRLDDGDIRAQVAYTVDGREVVFWNSFATNMTTDPVGREVEVLVNPDDPKQAVVGRGMVGGGTVGSAFVVFGVVVAVVGALLLLS